MKDLSFEDLAVGTRASFQRSLSTGDLDAFAAVSGDHSTLHMDPAYAQDAGFPDRVAHGMLSGGLYSALVGMYLPGKRALLMGADIDFHAPAFAGDVLTVTGEVVHRQEAYKVVELKAWIVNQNGKKLSKAKLRVGVRDGR